MKTHIYLADFGVVYVFPFGNADNDFRNTKTTPLLSTHAHFFFFFYKDITKHKVNVDCYLAHFYSKRHEPAMAGMGIKVHPVTLSLLLLVHKASMQLRCSSWSVCFCFEMCGFHHDFFFMRTCEHRGNVVLATTVYFKPQSLF